VGAYLVGACARVGECFTITAGPVFKVSDCTLPLFNRASGTSLGLYFLIIFFLCTWASLPLLFRIRSATTACITRLPKTLPS
jgi:hypothetical protein